MNLAGEVRNVIARVWEAGGGVWKAVAEVWSLVGEVRNVAGGVWNAAGEVGRVAAEVWKVLARVRSVAGGLRNVRAALRQRDATRARPTRQHATPASCRSVSVSPSASAPTPSSSTAAATLATSDALDSGQPARYASR